jgi:alpha-glucosidase (family GH31 glycosyl hydrolase)
MTMKNGNWLWTVVILPALLSTMACAQAKSADLRSGSLRMHLDFDPVRYSFANDKGVLLAAAPSGIIWNGEPLKGSPQTSCQPAECRLEVTGASHRIAVVTIRLSEHRASLQMDTASTGSRIEFHTGGLSPGYGLADHSVNQERRDTDVTGFSDDHFLANGGLIRLASNFIIYPRQGVGVVLVDPNEKIVRSGQEIVQGVTRAQRQTNMYYFFGTPKDIYAEFLHVRNDSGYPVFAPKEALFGVGWEAFGALGWNTNQINVKENVDRYRDLGYPLTWVAIGSGYWPSETRFHETTSFGLFDEKKYPDPAALFRHFHEEDLKVLLGLRICFVVDGPFTQEGLDKSYFLMKNGQSEQYHGEWPETPFYLLDAHKPAALDWYLQLVKRWTKFGVDGFKEDLYGYTPADMRDDKVNPINDALMKQGIYLIERTGYLASNGDLERINDFNFEQNQDRGPVNALALAYSGLPLVYPDTVGGTFAENKFDTTRTHAMEVYMMRNAVWVALHSGMAMGEPPWSFTNSEVAKVMLAAAQLHGRLQPYLYSQALKFAHDGYPWTMTPLPIAFPDDPMVYGRENEHVRGFEWMIGDALLATPLYGNDYATAMTRDVYLPRGRWLDYDTGHLYQGPTLLKDFGLPPDKTPLFVGGSGIVLEKIDGKNCVRIYPIEHEAHTELQTVADTRSLITVNAKDWSHPHVLDTNTQQPVTGSWVRHAFEFPLEQGHSYRVE